MKIEQQGHVHSPVEAVQQAIGRVMLIQTKRAYEELYGPYDDSDLKRLDTAALLGTAGNCHGACAYTLWELADNPETKKYFNRYILLTAQERDTPRDRFKLQHTYFLVRDIHKVWHAGSPANYVPGDTPQALHVHTGSLTEIVDHVRACPQGSLCRWPDAEDIDRYETYGQGTLPQGVRTSGHTGYITVFEIQSLTTRSLQEHTVKPTYTFISYDFSPPEILKIQKKP